MTRYEALVIAVLLLAVSAAVWLWPLYFLYAVIGIVWLVAVLAVAWFFGMAMAGGWGM